MDAALTSFAAQAARAVGGVSSVLDGLTGRHVDIGLASLAVAAMMCYVPHAVKVARVIEASKHIPKEEQAVAYALKQPRVSLELALKHAPRHLSNAIARAQGCHANLLETYPFFAAAILAAKVAGVESLKVDGAALAYLGLRTAYIFLYCWGNKGWQAYSRSTVWFNALAVTGWLTLQAATHGGAKGATGKTGSFW